MATLSMEDHVSVLFNGNEWVDITGAKGANHVIRCVGLFDQYEKLVRLVSNFPDVVAYRSHATKLHDLIKDAITKISGDIATSYLANKQDGSAGPGAGMTAKERVAMIFASHVGWINARRMLISNTYPLPVGALITEQAREIHDIQQMTNLNSLRSFKYLDVLQNRVRRKCFFRFQ